MTADNVVIVQENIPTITEKREDEDSGETQSIRVEGLALPFDEESRNGVKYTKESIKETQEQMIGCSVLWNHDAEIPSLGKVVDTEIKEGESEYRDGLYYEMELDTQGELESKVARKLEKGYISNVSIQAAVDDEGVEAPKVNVEDWYELTICNIAGFPQTTTDTSEQTIDGSPARVQLNGRSNLTETALAESLSNKEDMDTLEEAFEDAPSYDMLLSLYEDEEDALERAEELGLDDVHEHDVNGETMYMAGESHEAWRDAVDDEMSQDDDDEGYGNDDDDDEDKDDAEGANENSNKNAASESKDMSGDNSDSGDGDNSQEQPTDMEEMIEDMQETVNELSDRVESVEEQVANMQEKSDDEDDEDDMDDDDGESKQGFDPEQSENVANSTRNRIAESLNED